MRGIANSHLLGEARLKKAPSTPVTFATDGRLAARLPAAQRYEPALALSDPAALEESRACLQGVAEAAQRAVQRARTWVVAETRAQAVTSNRNANDLFACKWLRAPATKKLEGLAITALTPSCFLLPFC